MKRFLSHWPVIVLAALSVFLAAACAGGDSRCTALPGGSRYCLQTKTDIVPFDAQQKVDIVFDGRQETIIAQLEADALGMRFVGTTPFGQKLVQLNFDNQRVIVETAQMKGLDPVLLLALVQIATWPAEHVHGGLGNSAQLVESPGQRVVAGGGKDIVVIRYTRGRPPLGDMSIQFPGLSVEFSIVNLDVADRQ